MSHYNKIAGKAALVCVLLALAVSAFAAVPNPYSSTLTGAGTVDCLGTMTNVGGAHPYKFEYTYTFTDWTPGSLSMVTIGNTSRVRFYDAGNTISTYFKNPGFTGTSSVMWTLVSSTNPYPVNLGQVTFYYYCDTPYLKEVSNSVRGPGSVQATGMTLGMGVPEPAAICSMLFGLAGIAGAMRRNKK